MANQSTVKFDHREIAVIFSLFVFVSLLMFTVGILVGKGLSQPGAQTQAHNMGPTTASLPTGLGGHASGTSVNTDHPVEPAHPDAHADKSASHDPHDATAESHTTGAHGDSHAANSDHGGAAEHAPLELVPEKAHVTDPRGGLQEFPKTKAVEETLKNPRLQSVFDGGGHSPSRNMASASKPSGETFTVQVGSYPSKREASDRIEALKKLGFPDAFLSATQRDNKDTWYRVWLGHFPDATTAGKNGESLKARGEVKNYIVRRSDKTD